MGRQMKESGIKWAGQIPSAWSVQKIKYILMDRKENNKPIKTENILSLTAKQGVIPLAEKDGTGGNKPKDDLSQYRLAYPGDIVLNNMNIISGSVGLSRYFGCVSPVYYMLRPRYSPDDVRYFNYVFQVEAFQRSLIGYGKGILVKETDEGKYNTVRLRLSMDSLNSLLFPYPTSEEQQRISDFLDKKCASIDAVIDVGEKQLEKLKAYKHSVITRTVTKGLNKNAKMKDTGINWIGSIPEKWRIMPVKNLVSISNGCDPKLEGDIPVYGSGSASFKKCGEYKDGPAVLLGRKGSINTPNYVEGKYWNVDTAFDVKAKDNRLNLKYFYYCSVGFDYESFITQTTIPSMTQSDYGNMKIPFPEIAEQEAIVGYLDLKCSMIDKAISLRQTHVDKLREYKNSLIYAYVTGKKEVPHG